MLAVANQLLVRDYSQAVAAEHGPGQRVRPSRDGECGSPRGSWACCPPGAHWHLRQQAALGWQAHAARRAHASAGSSKYRSARLFAGDVDGRYAALYRPTGRRRRHLRRLDPDKPSGLSSRQHRVELAADLEFAMSAGRLEAMLREAAKRMSKVDLMPPNGDLVLSRVMASPRNKDAAVLTDVSFIVDPGRGPRGGRSQWRRQVVVGPRADRRVGWSRGAVTSTATTCRIGTRTARPLRRLCAAGRRALPSTVADNIARFDEPSEARDAATSRGSARRRDTGHHPAPAQGFNTRLGPDGHTCPADSASVWPWRGRSMARPSFWCWTSRIPIWTPRARRASGAPSGQCGRSGPSSSSSPTA